MAQAQDQAAPKLENARRLTVPTAILRPGEALPRPVDEMREAILAAVQSGRIEDLREAFELNEIRPDLGPDFGPGKETDPVAYWRRISGDGEGREILAALANVLALPVAVAPLGRDIENSKVYVWPYFAEMPLAMLTPAQEVDLLRLVPASTAKEMKARGVYSHWRLVIGAEGNWLALTRN
ncbi:MAG: hypothetical protein EKK41_07035 [Hyphomicrobiales bacterium]|nr:MAG: hypothetical protein EKK41_07035 [Hyphomicrobiales bacterium]